MQSPAPVEEEPLTALRAAHSQAEEQLCCKDNTWMTTRSRARSKGGQQPPGCTDRSVVTWLPEAAVPLYSAKHIQKLHPCFGPCFEQQTDQRSSQVPLNLCCLILWQRYNCTTILSGKYPATMSVDRFCPLAFCEVQNTAFVTQCELRTIVKSLECLESFRGAEAWYCDPAPWWCW